MANSDHVVFLDPWISTLELIEGSSVERRSKVPLSRTQLFEPPRSSSRTAKCVSGSNDLKCHIIFWYLDSRCWFQVFQTRVYSKQAYKISIMYLYSNGSLVPQQITNWLRPIHMTLTPSQKQPMMVVLANHITKHWFASPRHTHTQTYVNVSERKIWYLDSL